MQAKRSGPAAGKTATRPVPHPTGTATNQRGTLYRTPRRRQRHTPSPFLTWLALFVACFTAIFGLFLIPAHPVIGIAACIVAAAIGWSLPKVDES